MTLSPTTRSPVGGQPGGVRRRQVLVVMCVGMFLVQLDVTVVNVALPAIRTGLHASLAGQQWVVDAYAVVLAALLLAGGTVGDRYGHKQVVLAGLGLFGLGSLGCALAPSIRALIALRAVQGLGAALLLPGTLAVITHAFPERGEQTRAVGIWAGVSAAAPLAIRVVTDTSTDHPRRLDLPGTVLAAIGLAAAVYAVITAGAGHTGPGLWATVTVAGLAVLGFAL